MKLKTLKILILLAFFCLGINEIIIHYKSKTISALVAQKEINFRLGINIDSISTVEYYPYLHKAEFTLTSQNAIDKFIRTIPKNIRFAKKGEEYGNGWFNFGDTILFDANNDFENLWLEVYRHQNKIIYYRRNWEHSENTWFGSYYYIF